MTVLPIIAAGLATWLLVHVQVFGNFGITHNDITSVITNLGVFGVTALLTWLTQHHVLKGSYSPSGPRRL